MRTFLLSSLLLAWLALPAQASVFGDGDPGNGDEDNRIRLASPEWRELGLAPWNMSAGTVHCDGANRGTAMILDVTGFGPQPEGLVLITAAHVLLDLESGEPFGACRFHYMGLDHLPGYQADIDLGTARRGQFDAARPTEALEFGQQDWALLHVPQPIAGVVPEGRVKPRAFADVSTAGGSGTRFRLIGYSKRHEGISVSLGCSVEESGPGDLGGGAWRGQLLDDCDSGQGASGGGLVASTADGHFLVGIRTGAHWDEQVYPAQDFPAGPPAGAPWDVRSNTNFSRAMDAQLLASLRAFLEQLAGT